MAKTETREQAAKGAGAGTALIDEELKARWQQDIAVYRSATNDETRGWDTRYEALARILESDPPLYLAGGYRSAKEFLQAEVPDQSERTVRQYIRVARHFEPEDESRYGIAKLEVLIDYLEALNGGKLPKATIDPGKTKVRVTVKSKAQTMWFAQATRDQLRAAARAASTVEAERARGGEPTVVKKVKAVLKGTAFAAVAVSAKNGAVTFSGVPDNKVAAFGKVIAKVR